MAAWSRKQRFALRASTMLLLFVAGLMTVGSIDFLFYAFVENVPYGSDIFWRLGINAKLYVKIAAAFSLVFLIHSIIKKQPQIQFVVELIICVIYYILISTYE